MSFLIAAVIFFGLGGWRYYTTPLRVRAYEPLHAVLRPSGSGGRLLGIVGTLIMACTLFYVARKKWKPLARFGSPKAWLEVHVFCGLVGPALIAFHTSFKFNGLISVAFWSMVLVVVSGFVGRYLYVRIPRTLRGAELDKNTLEERATALKAQLAESTLPLKLLLRIEDFERRVLPPPGKTRSLLGYIFGEFKTRRELRLIQGEMRSGGMSREILDDACQLVADRAEILRRIAYLDLTRRLFALWHVFHRPLVWVLFGVLLIHVGVAIYFGYAYGGSH